MTERKSSGYWKNWNNFEQELQAVIDQIEHFPTQKELEQHGTSSLSAAMKYHGGSNKVRQKMGFPVTKHDNGYYTWDNLTDELHTLWHHHPELDNTLPSANWLRTHGHEALASGIARHHGFRKVREKLGHKQPLQQPHGYYKDETRLLQTLHELWHHHPELDGQLPAQHWLTQHHYSTLAAAIVKYHGGFPTFRKKLNLQRKLRYTHGELKNHDRFAQELESLFHNHPELKGKLPSSTWLKDHGYQTLYTAMKNHGGINYIRTRLGQHLLHKQQGYWKDFTNIQHEIEHIITTNEELNGQFPTVTWMRHHGHSSLAGAMTQYHGGMSAVRHKMGFEPFDPRTKQKEQLEAILDEYLHA